MFHVVAHAAWTSGPATRLCEEKIASSGTMTKWHAYKACGSFHGVWNKSSFKAFLVPPAGLLAMRNVSKNVET